MAAPVPRQFRLEDEVLEKLDWLREHWAEGVTLSRTDMLRAIINKEYTRRNPPGRGPGRPRKNPTEEDE